MTDLRKAAEMALEALERGTTGLAIRAIPALRQALAQPKQEPIAWVRDLTSPQPHCVTSLKYLSIADTDAGVKYIPVYTAPPSKPWVGLTDGEIEIYGNQFNGSRLVREIEGLLRERNK